MAAICRAAILLFLAAPAALYPADQLLLTLQAPSSIVSWQDEFVLTLEIYGAPSADPPNVTIDGLDQFQLRGQFQNLLKVPGGKTVKWILTYTLIAVQNGSFKLGPARAVVENRTYTSNILFINVEGAPKAQPEPEPVPEALITPLVRSAKEVGDRVLLLIEAEKSAPYKGEGFSVTLRLLTQLPVENLRYIEEAQFPGFLKHDFPYTDRPQAERATYRGQPYASFDLQKFLVFPLHDGPSALPPFRCAIRVSVPSGSFAAASLKLDLERASNSELIRVRALPQPVDLVGEFSFHREIVSDEPRAKTVRMVVEGNGLLSTFAFPELSAAGLEQHTLSASITAELSGERLLSRKTIDAQAFPKGNTTDIVLPSLHVSQFDPLRGAVSVLSVPELPLRYSPPPPPEPSRAPLPPRTGWVIPAMWLLAALTAAVLLFRALWPQRRSRIQGFSSVSRHKKPQLQIPKNAARNLYQQISYLVAMRDTEGDCLTETLKFHLPENDWDQMEDVLLRLEWTAFSPARGAALTYGELKELLINMEKRWLD